MCVCAYVCVCVCVSVQAQSFRSVPAAHAPQPQAWVLLQQASQQLAHSGGERGRHTHLLWSVQKNKEGNKWNLYVLACKAMAVSPFGTV